MLDILSIISLISNSWESCNGFSHVKWFDNCILLQVKKLEDAAIQLVEAYAYCTHHSSAIESIGNSYQPGPEVLEFFYNE